MKKTTTGYADLPGKPGEKLDCSVRALAVAADISYDEAHAALKEAGRPDGKRTPHATSRELYRKLGFRCCIIRQGGIACHGLRMTLMQFIAANPRGRFIVHRRGHAFAVLDGVVHDWARGTGPRSRVTNAWQIL